jgi:ribonucleoside-diphosphate reductase alpha chain
MTKELLDYFHKDELSASVWYGKYALKNEKKEVVETTPLDMHIRMAKELARAEAKYDYPSSDSTFAPLSLMGKAFYYQLSEKSILSYLDRFKWIIPQGSIMSSLGNFYKLQSLSNCFVVPEPLDSYGGIFKADQEIAQLEKRRGGVGTTLNKLRYDDAAVLNAAGTSTGAHSFMGRFSNTTREVAQNGRRGALMLLMTILHPDVRKFIIKKKDRTQVTGANVSVQIIDEFMRAVENNQDFLCRFPIDVDMSKYEEDGGFNEWWVLGEYDKIWEYDGAAFMKVKSREIFDLIVEMAWENAEPGVAYMDRVHDYSPEGVYEQFRAIASNPCGEQWLQAYDACRLLAVNLFSFVVNPFRSNAHLDMDKVYEVFYIQQRLADDVVDLEIEYVDKIIAKIEADPEPDDVKATELNLWKQVKDTASASRRTGCGFTALGDMLAALGLKYDSDEAITTTELVMKTKLQAELDCSIDLAILRGTFTGWDRDKEFSAIAVTQNSNTEWTIQGTNSFYKMLAEDFEPQSKRMYQYGRRNVSWSTVAPTGSVSIVALLTKYSNTSGGLEPHFKMFYFRNKKVNPSDKGARVDFKDQNGDSWMTYPVVMGGFKEWLDVYAETKGLDPFVIEDLTEKEMDELFKQSPYFGSCADDISWEKRVEIQGAIQKYTTNAISSTLNLPKDVSKETVSNIYFKAWKAGLKGVTVYRDGSRSGVLVTSANSGDDKFVYHDAPKRPKALDAECTVVRVKGNPYAVIVGLLDGKPYEVFAYSAAEEDTPPVNSKGTLTKVKKGVYNFVYENGNTIEHVQNRDTYPDEQILTRPVSGMMRHGVNPKFILEQIDKCELEIVSFGKALGRVLKKYIPEKELLERYKCSDCGSSNVRFEEGCAKCSDCGSSKCG